MHLDTFVRNRARACTCTNSCMQTHISTYTHMLYTNVQGDMGRCTYAHVHQHPHIEVQFSDGISIFFYRWQSSAGRERYRSYPSFPLSAVKKGIFWSGSVAGVAVAVVVIIRQHDDHHLCSCPTVLSWQLYGLVGRTVFECPAECGCNHTERYHILAEAAWTHVCIAKKLAASIANTCSNCLYLHEWFGLASLMQGENWQKFIDPQSGKRWLHHTESGLSNVVKTFCLKSLPFWIQFPNLWLWLGSDRCQIVANLRTQVNIFSKIAPVSMVLWLTCQFSHWMTCWNIPNLASLGALHCFAVSLSIFSLPF